MATIDDNELRDLATFAKQRWGLVLEQGKRVMIASRVQALRSKVTFSSIKELLTELDRVPNARLELELFDVLSTNYTSFFREDAHFEALQEGLLKPWKASGGGRLRIWSAGCSMGCEPYTLSMLLNEMSSSVAIDQARILATDLSNDVLRKAKAGVYTKDHIGATDPDLIKKYMLQRLVHGRAVFEVKPVLRKPVTFGRLNLMDPWTLKGPFDAIFCRNVMIYFDRDTRIALARRFLKLLAPGGMLFVGTSESLTDYGLPLDVIAHGAYRSAADTGRVAA